MKNHVTLLDNIKRPIKFTFWTFAEFEEITGTDYWELAGKKFSMKQQISLLYVGLKNADPELSLSIEQVGELVNFKSLKEMIEALNNDMVELNGAVESEKK